MNPRLVCDVRVHGKSFKQERYELCERERIFLSVIQTFLATKTWAIANPKPNSNNFF